MKINFEFNKVSDHPEFNNLRNASYAQFHGLCSQIAQLKIDKLIIFNGRLDFTAAAVGAAKKMGIDFHTVERSWLGYGLNITHQGVPLDLAPYRQVIKSNLGTELTEQQQRLSKLTLSRRSLNNQTVNFNNSIYQIQVAHENMLSFCIVLRLFLKGHCTRIGLHIFQTNMH